MASHDTVQLVHRQVSAWSSLNNNRVQCRTGYKPGIVRNIIDFSMHNC